MEIKVNIPQNDYIQPTEVREDVVQKICDVFLGNRAGYYHNIFHPVNDGGYRVRTLGLRIHKKSGRAYEFDHKALFDSDDFVKIHGCEMEAAFQALIKAGYHMYRVYEYGSWMGYACDKKPHYEGNTEVFEFNDFID